MRLTPVLSVSLLLGWPVTVVAQHAVPAADLYRAVAERLAGLIEHEERD